MIKHQDFFTDLLIVNRVLLLQYNDKKITKKSFIEIFKYVKCRKCFTGGVCIKQIINQIRDQRNLH